MTTIRPLFTWRSALCESDLPATTRHVALTLSLHMNERGGSAFPSQETLARETGLHTDTVKKQLRVLVDLGWLTKAVSRLGRHRGTRVEYHATVPEGIVNTGAENTGIKSTGVQDPQSTGAQDPVVQGSTTPVGTHQELSSELPESLRDDSRDTGIENTLRHLRQQQLGGKLDSRHSEAALAFAAKVVSQGKHKRGSQGWKADVLGALHEYDCWFAPYDGDGSVPSSA